MIYDYNWKYPDKLSNFRENFTTNQWELESEGHLTTKNVFAEKRLTVSLLYYSE